MNLRMAGMGYSDVAEPCPPQQGQSMGKGTVIHFNRIAVSRRNWTATPSFARSPFGRSASSASFHPSLRGPSRANHSGFAVARSPRVNKTSSRSAKRYKETMSWYPTHDACYIRGEFYGLSEEIHFHMSDQ